MKKILSITAFCCAMSFLFVQNVFAENEPSSAPTQKSCEMASQSDNNELELAKELIKRKDYRGIQILQGHASAGNSEAKRLLGECIDNLKKAAARNDPQGTLYLANLYSDKNNIFYDAKLADACYRKAIELNAPEAKSLYGGFLFYHERYTEAIPLLEQSSDESLSLMVLAGAYQHGLGVPLNISKAVEFAEKLYNNYGADPFSAELCFTAGVEELLTHNLTPTALHRIKLAADQGHAEAQYFYSKFVADFNQDDSFNYMLKSADNGFSLALPKIGDMLMERGDFKRALKYFVLASLDHKTKGYAVSRLADIYHLHLKMPRAGHFWAMQGADLCWTNCMNLLGLKEYYTPGEEHLAKAAALFAASRLLGEDEQATMLLNEIISNHEKVLLALAEKKNTDALLALGIIKCMHEKGHPDIAAGIQMLEEAANRKNKTACRLLGYLYGQDTCVETNSQRSLAWFLKGAEYDDTVSAKMAALQLFHETLSNPEKLEECRKIFEKAIELEILDVMWEYGMIMEHVAKDLKKAEELYRQSAVFGDSRAMVSLHDMLLSTNQEEAFDFLIQAVNLRDTNAEIIMGDLQKVQNQPREAFSYYLKANLHGDRKLSSGKLAECWLTGYGCEPNVTCFWNSAEEAYKNGDAEVCYLLGSVYQDGKICDKALDKAKTYFEEGAKRGSERCKKALH